MIYRENFTDKAMDMLTSHLDYIHAYKLKAHLLFIELYNLSYWVVQLKLWLKNTRLVSTIDFALVIFFKKILILKWDS